MDWSEVERSAGQGGRRRKRYLKKKYQRKNLTSIILICEKSFKYIFDKCIKTLNGFDKINICLY